LRVRLVAGTTNLFNGNKNPPSPADAIPTMTYQVGDMKVQYGGRTVELRDVINAHTVSDTLLYFATANVLALVDTFRNGRYPNIDWSNGGGIDGMIAANERYLSAGNEDTKIVPGHGPLATKQNLREYLAMLIEARARVKKLFDEGKSEREAIAANPLADLSKKWATPEGLGTGPNF